MVLCCSGSRILTQPTEQKINKSHLLCFLTSHNTVSDAQIYKTLINISTLTKNQSSFCWTQSGGDRHAQTRRGRRQYGGVWRSIEEYGGGSMEEVKDCAPGKRSSCTASLQQLAQNRGDAARGIQRKASELFVSECSFNPIQWRRLRTRGLACYFGHNVWYNSMRFGTWEERDDKTWYSGGMF